MCDRFFLSKMDKALTNQCYIFINPEIAATFISVQESLNYFFVGVCLTSQCVQLKPQETERCQTLALNYLCKLAGCTFNVQPANLHNIFSHLKACHGTTYHVFRFIKCQTFKINHSFTVWPQQQIAICVQTNIWVIIFRKRPVFAVQKKSHYTHQKRLVRETNISTV